VSGNVKIANWGLGMIGAAVGGTLGYLGFFFLVRQGLYAMVLPGTLLGLGCGLLSGVKSSTLGIVSGLLATLLGIFVEWRFRPFVADDSFTYFISHLHDLKSGTLALIGIGGLFGYWFGRGRGRGVWPRRAEDRHASVD
jgi:hypothetical protein